MAYKWIEITQDFDRSLPFTKVRWDLSKDAAWATVGGNSVNGYFSEVPNINADGLRWSDITGSTFGYAGQYRFTLREPQGITNGYVFSCKAEGFTDHSIPQYATLIEGEIYEYTYPLDLYWAGIGIPTNPLSAPEGTGIFVYVDSGSISVDTEEIAADSGASSYTISVSAETGVSWSASTNDSWISLAPTTGEGNGSITVSVAEAGYIARTGEITITSSEGDSISVQVSQAKKALILTRKDMYQGENLINKMYRNGELIYQRLIAPILSVSTSSFVLEATGGTDSFTVTANYPYTVSSDADWLTVEKDGPTCSFTATDNSAEGNVSRSATITVSSEGKTVEVSIAQKGATIIYSGMPLTFEIISGGTISWKSRNVQEATISYSINEGPWVVITSNATGASFNVSEGDKVRFKGANAAYARGDSAYNTFSGGTAIFNAYGNIMSLIYEDDFLDKYALSAGYTFHSLFRWTNIISAENLVLPATTLQQWCYKSMFEACSLLVSAPKELPATTLVDACYYGMFYNCYSLENAPIIKGENSAWFGCQVTFNSCALLNHLECHLTDLNGCGGWLTGVSATGTFIKNPALTTWTSDANGIPAGWTVIDAE